MRRRGVLVGAFVTTLGAAAATVRVLRALPLVDALPMNDGGGGKKDDKDKKDMKKKGTGPRTRRKKAKKGKA